MTTLNNTTTVERASVLEQAGLSPAITTSVSTTPSPTLPRLERAEIDPVFKEVMTFNFGQLSLPIETQVEVSRLPRTMDALVLLGKFDTATPAEGSFNMSYQSMFDNQENATYSRSKDYAEFFLAKWEEAVVPGHEGER